VLVMVGTRKGSFLFWSGPARRWDRSPGQRQGRTWGRLSSESPGWSRTPCAHPHAGQRAQRQRGWVEV